jgi:hypothetical protein
MAPPGESELNAEEKSVFNSVSKLGFSEHPRAKTTNSINHLFIEF